MRGALWLTWVGIVGSIAATLFLEETGAGFTFAIVGFLGLSWLGILALTIVEPEDGWEQR
jgi:uncharacterized membrane protein